MNHPYRSFAGFLSFLLVVLTAGAQAGGEMKESKSVETFSPFARGMRELQFGVSGYYSFANYSAIRPHLNDVGASARLGWMLTDPSGSGIWRGNYEFLVEVFGSGIVEGPGNLFAGVTLILRHNFLPPDSKWAPYFQIGGGGAYSDAHEEEPQRLLGSAFSFNLQAGFGVRYLFSDRCAIFAEANYRHLSNASIAERNSGLNAAGVVLGVSTFF